MIYLNVVKAETVGELCVQWGSCLTVRDLDQAEKFRHSVHEMLATMEPDDKVIAYVQLLDLKNDIIMET